MKTKKSECLAAVNLDWPDSTDNIALNALTVNNDEDNHGKGNNDEDNHGKDNHSENNHYEDNHGKDNHGDCHDNEDDEDDEESLYGLCTKVNP